MNADRESDKEQRGGDIVLRPVGVVRTSRTDATDDFWGGEVSTIELDASQFGPKAVRGLEEFSHLEVVFLFDRVDPKKVVTGARRPRGREDMPEVGIFAQRAKARPNRIAVSRCRLLSVDGLKLTVAELDAIDGTPVLDVKPWLVELGPRGDVRQPDWTREMMAYYFHE